MTSSPLANAVIFACLALVVFVVAIAVAARAAAFDLRKQIVDQQNVAAAILAGAVVLGIAWIIAATMH